MFLVANNLFKQFPENTGKGMQTVISDLSLSLNEGECLGIIGRSGCGKTTLLKLLAGILKPDKGIIQIKGEEHNFKNYPVAFVFQEPYLLPWRTVRDNIKLACQISDTCDEKTIDKLLVDVGLSESASKYPHEISGGMQSRCSLARALDVPSKFLFMDEPFGNLDPATRCELQLKVKKIIRQEKRCAVLVTHSVEEALFLSNKLFIFRDFCGGIEGKDFLAINNIFFDKSHPNELWQESKAIEMTENIIAFLTRGNQNNPSES